MNMNIVSSTVHYLISLIAIDKCELWLKSERGILISNLLSLLTIEHRHILCTVVHLGLWRKRIRSLMDHDYMVFEVIGVS